MNSHPIHKLACLKWPYLTTHSPWQACTWAHSSLRSPKCRRSEQIQWIFHLRSLSWIRSTLRHLEWSCTSWPATHGALSWAHWLCCDGAHPLPESPGGVCGKRGVAREMRERYCNQGMNKRNKTNICISFNILFMHTCPFLYTCH